MKRTNMEKDYILHKFLNQTATAEEIEQRPCLADALGPEGRQYSIVKFLCDLNNLADVSIQRWNYNLFAL